MISVDNIVPWKSEGQSEAVMMRSAPQKSGHPLHQVVLEKTRKVEEWRAIVGSVGGRNPRCRLLKPQDVAHCSPSPPQSRLPVGTGDTVYAHCYRNYITAIMSMLTNQMGLQPEFCVRSGILFQCMLCKNVPIENVFELYFLYIT